MSNFQVGSNIVATNKGWTFSGEVAENFDNHVKSSIPSYIKFHDLTNSLVRKLIKDSSDTNVLDFGCSTGTFLCKLRESFQKVNLYGVDPIKEMLDLAKKKNISAKFATKLDLIKKENFDVITSHFTLQFIQYSEKGNYLEVLKNRLNSGGAIIIFEKVIEDEGFIQDLFAQSYIEFKQKNNFSNEEIFNKTQSLVGQMFPLQRSELHSLFSKCGFNKINLIAKDLMFEGYLLQI